MTSAQIAVLSDDRLFCEGVLQLLRGFVSAETTHNPRLSDASRWAHAVVLLDARLSQAIDFCGALSNHGALAILLGAPDDEAWGRQAIAGGARGLLTKQAAPGDVLKAIAAVRAGEIWAPRRWLSAWVIALNGPRAGSAIPHGWRLSPRERQIVELAAGGVANKEMADRLGISEATVKVHLTHIFKKVRVNGRGELAAAYFGRQASVDRRNPNVVSSAS